MFSARRERRDSNHSSLSGIVLGADMNESNHTTEKGQNQEHLHSTTPSRAKSGDETLGFLQLIPTQSASCKHTHTHADARTHALTHTQMHARTHTHAHTRASVRTHGRTRAHTNRHPHAEIHTRTLTHIHAHTCTHEINLYCLCYQDVGEL